MHDFNVISLPYSGQLIQQYRKLHDLPGFVLLESSDINHGRYDIVSACPYDKKIFYPGDGSLVQFVKSIEHQMASFQLPVDLPFQGGCIGYFSYDFARYFINEHYFKSGLVRGNQERYFDMSFNKPIVDPRTPLAELGFYDWAIITDHALKKVSLLAVNRQKSTPLIVEEVLNRLSSDHPLQLRTSSISSFKALIEKDEYVVAFETIQSYLRHGRCYQVNFTQPFQADYAGNTWDLYEKIRAQNPVPFAAYLRMTTLDILSISPERFLKFDERKLLASPIKGTAKRLKNKVDDQAQLKNLLQCEKNRAENVMIVDMLRNDLSKISQSGSVKVNQLFEAQSFTSVHHLVSHIVANPLDTISPLSLFLSCFPGASITGAPKLEAMRVIRELEAYNRGIYCGSIGYFSAHGRFDTNIAIRTLIAKENILTLSSGGGIVMDSDCHEEYEECLTKIASIRRAIALE